MYILANPMDTGSHQSVIIREWADSFVFGKNSSASLKADKEEDGYTIRQIKYDYNIERWEGSGIREWHWMKEKNKK